MWLGIVALALAAGERVPVSGSLGPGLEGTYNLTVRLSADASGAVSPWTETQPVLVEGGAFSLFLGQNAAVASIDFSGPLWIAVSVDGGPYSTSVPVGFAPRAMYAAEAGDAATVGGYAPSSFQAAAWRPAWSEILGDPSESSSLTSRVHALAYDTPTELTTALSGQYRAASYVTAWSELAGVPADNAALTSRVQTLAYDTVGELTAALDGTYLRQSGGTVSSVTTTGNAAVGGNLAVTGNLTVSGFELPYQRHISGRDWLSTGAITISPQANAIYDTTTGAMTWGANFADANGAPASFNALPPGMVASNARLRVRWEMSRECVTADCDGYWRMYDGSGGYVQVQSYDNDSGGLAIGNSGTWLRTVTGQGGVANRLTVDVSVIPGQNEMVFVEAIIGSTRRVLTVDLNQNLNPATGLWMEFVRGDTTESYREHYIRTEVSRSW